MKKAALLGLMIVLSFGADAAIVWTGPNVLFSKAANADFTLAANQDRLNGDVWLTRAATQAPFNFKSEFSYSASSPAGTTWAFLGLLGNTGDPSVFKAANYSSLTFQPFAAALNNQVGTLIVGRKGVLHLTASDVYLDITFDSYAGGVNGGGAFSYTRATEVPEPATAALAVTAALAGWVVLRQRSR